MRWPFDRRANAAHAWGAIGAGTALLVGIAGVLAPLRAGDPGFRWWWPTNWMGGPLAIIAAGCALLVIPVRRTPRRRPEPGDDGPDQWAGYLEQVRQITPADPLALVDREAELAELTEFCLDPGCGPYAFWQAGPWAGKTALLSTFVARPSAQLRSGKTRIVSFFITARLAAHDTREAFTQMLLDQLAGLTGQDLPAALPEATRDVFLLNLLARAARRCEQAGGRLVLVVDGLDEDRSPVTGPQARSIAGLLPASPPAGLRVIVSGRPDPPIPDDVPDWHPLRNPAIIRLLAPSPHALDLARLARQELDRLLHGSEAEQDVLGLLTAARGGLSAADLADLAGVALWDVEDIVRHAEGRTFTARPGQHRPGGDSPVYLLGHEELQATASRYLAGRFPVYYARLAAWAARWRDMGWPPATPEYLLAGYYQLLHDLGDLPAQAALAGDAGRHDRMLDLTGGDAAALTEIRTALDQIASQDHPDLADALRLAYHRGQLARRNANVPQALPAVWATMGNTARALALATSIPDLYRRAGALVQVACAVAGAGLHQPTAAAATQAEAAARSISDPYSRALALAKVAELAGTEHARAALAASQAKSAVRWFTDTARAGEVLKRRMAVFAAGGTPDDAPENYLSMTDRQAEALTQTAATLAVAGQHEQAAAAASQAEAAARSDTQEWPAAVTLAKLAHGLAGAGQPEQAAAAASRAEASVQSVGSPDTRAEALAHIAAGLAGAGQHDRAQAVAVSITIPDWQVLAFVWNAGALARAGQREQAAATASQARRVARSITSSYGRDTALVLVARALAEAGRHKQAEAAARSATDPNAEAEALAAVAEVLARAGQPEQAAATAGRARAVARSIAIPDLQAPALAQIAEVLAGAGLHEDAAAAASQAKAAAQFITDPQRRAEALSYVAGALASAGQDKQAEAAARSISDSGWRAEAWERIAGGLTTIGQLEKAATAASHAEAAARSINDSAWRAEVLAKVAGVLAEAGQDERAGAVAHSITDPEQQAEALAECAMTLGVAGHKVSASRMAAAALVVGDWTTGALPAMVLSPCPLPPPPQPSY